jgi:hypothetical protein
MDKKLSNFGFSTLYPMSTNYRELLFEFIKKYKIFNPFALRNIKQPTCIGKETFNLKKVKKYCNSNILVMG